MPFQKYLLEIKWRLFYCILTFLVCFSVLLSFIDTFFLIEIKPLTDLGHKSFLATHVTDFFLATLSVSLFFSQLFTFPIAAYHVYYFFIPSFYASQLFFLRYYIICSFFSYSVSFLLIYNILAPEALSFLIQWGSLTTNDLLNLELDVRIKEYLEWVNRSYSMTSLILQSFFSLILYLLFSLKASSFFHYLRFYRKHLIFTTLCLLYAVLPPDLMLQFASFSVLYFLVELFFYTACFRLKQSTFSW